MMTMSELRRVTDLTALLDRMQARCDGATEGPWERGYRYHVQASTHCECRADYGPLVGIDPDGEYGEMHIHLLDTPIWEEGITARDDSTGGIAVVIETSEHGTMSDSDADFITAARTDMPRLISALRALHEKLGIDDYCEACTHGDCETSRTIAEALGVES